MWKYRLGFTLLETLLTIAIIAALFVIVASSVNILDILAKTRNARREAHLNDLLKAITAYTIDQDGTLPPAATLPAVFGSTTFSGAEIIATNFDGAEAVGTGDMDGDGDIDVVGVSDGGSGTRWWARSGTAPNLTWTGYTVDGTFKGEEEVAVGDMDGDGKLDIVGVSEDDDLVAWWRNQGGLPPTFSARVTIQSGHSEVRVVEIADMDNDGDRDVVVGSDPSSKKVRFYRNNGSPLTPNWEYRDIEDNFGHTHGIAVSDLDSDGDRDIVGASKDFKDISWWVNSGTPFQNNWTRYDIDPNFHDAEDVFAAKIDGDTDIDVVAVGGGGVSYWENDGTPNNNDWVERAITTNFGGDVLSGADFDGDGDIDVVASSEGGDKIAWWENKGALGFSGTVVIESGSEVNDVEGITVADIDSDGDGDIVAAVEGNDTVAWWKNLRIAGVSQAAPVSQISGVFKPVCLSEVTLAACDAAGGVSLTVLVPQHLGSVPVDPSGSGAVMTGYEVRVDAGTPVLYVRAPKAELGKTIELRGSVGIQNCLVWEIVSGERICVVYQ